VIRPRIAVDSRCLGRPNLQADTDHEHRQERVRGAHEAREPDDHARQLDVQQPHEDQCEVRVEHRRREKRSFAIEGSVCLTSGRATACAAAPADTRVARELPTSNNDAYTIAAGPDER